MMSSCFQLQLLELAYRQCSQQDPQSAGQMWSPWSVNQHNVNRCRKIYNLPKSACQCILPWAAVDKTYSWSPVVSPFCNLQTISSHPLTLSPILIISTKFIWVLDLDLVMPSDLDTAWTQSDLVPGPATFCTRKSLVIFLSWIFFWVQKFAFQILPICALSFDFICHLCVGHVWCSTTSCIDTKSLHGDSKCHRCSDSLLDTTPYFVCNFICPWISLYPNSKSMRMPTQQKWHLVSKPYFLHKHTLHVFSDGQRWCLENRFGLFKLHASDFRATVEIIHWNVWVPSQWFSRNKWIWLGHT
jgi:hypothetical protein